MNEELLEAISQLMDSRFSELTKPIRKNLVVLTFAFILVLSAVRSGQGRLRLFIHMGWEEWRFID